MALLKTKERKAYEKKYKDRYKRKDGKHLNPAAPHTNK